MTDLLQMIKKHWLVIALAILILYQMSKVWAKQTIKMPEDANEIKELTYLGNLIMPRGMRNNNPGNLVRTNIPWEGKIPHDKSTDSKFEQFNYYWQGVRAMLKDMINDMTQDGDNTIRKLIYRYAPPMENRTDDYIAFVSNESGYDADETLDTQATTLYRVSRAMGLFENGTATAITEPVFNYAYTNLS